MPDNSFNEYRHNRRIDLPQRRLRAKVLYSGYSLRKNGLHHE